MRSIPPAAPALAAAALFGASTPLAKLLVGDMHAWLLAGLLYLGSGLGLCLALAWRWWRLPGAGRAQASFAIPRGDIAWLLGAIVSGGMVGPALLMLGLAETGGATAALLLNFESVLTACIAWLVFREGADRRIVIGMSCIVAGGFLLSWVPGTLALSSGAWLILGACACWAVDNNLTRRVSANDAMLVAGLKGLVAGSCNTALALAGGATWPALSAIGASLVVGLFGYGLSLSLFVLALRRLGTARTGAYFSVAPLFGVGVSWLIWPGWPTPVFWPAAALMSLGVWLHVREHHEHEHHHEAVEHSHAHRHDEHHQHGHEFAWAGDEPHVHRHRHQALTHTHPHHPDIHHRHTHP